jgi:hypothetical protein
MEDGALTMVASGSSMLTCGREEAGEECDMVAAADKGGVMGCSFFENDDTRSRTRSGVRSVGLGRVGLAKRCERRAKQAGCVCGEGEGGGVRKGGQANLRRGATDLGAGACLPNPAKPFRTGTHSTGTSKPSGALLPLPCSMFIVQRSVCATCLYTTKGVCPKAQPAQNSSCLPSWASGEGRKA